MSDDETKHDYRWGIDVSSKDGFTSIFNFILNNYSDMGINSNEMMFIIHIASYHYDSEQGCAFPSLNTIAKKMGKDIRTIERIVNSLTEKGFMLTTPRVGKTSIYSVHNFAILARWFDACKDKGVTPNLNDYPGYTDLVKSVKGRRQKSLPKNKPTLDTDVKPTLDTDVTLRRKDQKENDKEVMSAAHSKSPDDDFSNSMDDAVEDEDEGDTNKSDYDSISDIMENYLVASINDFITSSQVMRLVYCLDCDNQNRYNEFADIFASMCNKYDVNTSTAWCDFIESASRLAISDMPDNIYMPATSYNKWKDRLLRQSLNDRLLWTRQYWQFKEMYERGELPAS